MIQRQAKFTLGDVVRHRLFPFRGVIFDVDPQFANTEEWWLAIPEAIRPKKDQPFYHVLAENDDSFYTAYVSEQNLLPDSDNGPVGHPQAGEMFELFDGQRYQLRTDLPKPN
ncbi:heat shock protein HspQ [Hyphobacterium marinum]|uniref:Heat shock protein HspQ n=1 Tax=Hyphobacterium marinum TaxID=3116574 RepID=A0ABU7M011_9PROT|nr:heat shock protein HspQ [Hyphobacterium sp. Y6023]MEE2567138.1 heat shock protein HspQ [Hyphobacterium sp. Y6023]